MTEPNTDPHPEPMPEIFEAHAPSLAWVGPPEAQAKLIAAIAKAQLQFGSVERAASGQIGHRRFAYAPLVEYTKATRKALAAEGVVTLQAIHTSPHATPARKLHRLTTQVCGHGARLEIHLDFRPPSSSSGKQDDSAEVKDTQEWGKLTTYLRRYAYATVHVLDGDPDLDDGDADERDREPQQQKSRQPPAPPAKQERRAEPPPRAERPKPPARPADDMERVLSTPVPANANGAAAMGGPADITVPEDVRNLSDDDLRGEIKHLALEVLQHNITTAQRRCIQLTGKPREELDRQGLEVLLVGFRADAAAAKEAATAQRH